MRACLCDIHLNSITLPFCRNQCHQTIILMICFHRHLHICVSVSFNIFVRDCFFKMAYKIHKTYEDMASDNPGYERMLINPAPITQRSQVSGKKFRNVLDSRNRFIYSYLPYFCWTYCYDMICFMNKQKLRNARTRTFNSDCAAKRTEKPKPVFTDLTGEHEQVYKRYFILKLLRIKLENNIFFL